MSEPTRATRAVSRDPGGLCPSCRHLRRVESPKGSTFLRCGRSDADPAYPKYPPQPVVVCRGHER
jgi:hypothetical protein